MEAAPRFVRLAAALLAALAIFAAPTAAREAELDINGPAEFIASMEDGLDALQSIGLRAYVTTQIGTLSADLEPTCTTFTGPQAGQPCLTRTDRPPDNYGRATVHLRWPHPVWASPTETAAYLAHEATHVYRYHQDQYTWADEAAPTSVEFVVRWALRSRQQQLE